MCNAKINSSLRVPTSYCRVLSDRLFNFNRLCYVEDCHIYIHARYFGRRGLNLATNSAIKTEIALLYFTFIPRYKRARLYHYIRIYTIFSRKSPSISCLESEAHRVNESSSSASRNRVSISAGCGKCFSKLIEIRSKSHISIVTDVGIDRR